VMMEHCTKGGENKLVERCSYPLTGLGCVKRVYTDLAVIDLTVQPPRVLRRVEGLEMDALQARTGFALQDGGTGR
jgi:3-oxoadipate CoA-transferase, beta subunit